MANSTAARRSLVSADESHKNLSGVVSKTSWIPNLAWFWLEERDVYRLIIVRLCVSGLTEDQYYLFQKHHMLKKKSIVLSSLVWKLTICHYQHWLDSSNLLWSQFIHTLVHVILCWQIKYKQTTTDGKTVSLHWQPLWGFQNLMSHHWLEIVLEAFTRRALY